MLSIKVLGDFLMYELTRNHHSDCFRYCLL